MNEDTKPPAGASPEQLHQRWSKEIASAEKRLAAFHKKATAAVQAYENGSDTEALENGRTRELRWELFWSTVTTLEALLYGRSPQVTVTRRYADARDDLARIVAEFEERLLNTEFESGGDGFAESLADALQDRLLAGFGINRVRYEAIFERIETEQTAAADGVEVTEGTVLERKVDERVDVEYVHWKDTLWGACKTWRDCPWLAFKADMTREDVEQRFGMDVADLLTYTTHEPDENKDEVQRQPWAQAAVWEIWDKQTGTVLWWHKGAGRILDEKKDPYGLPGFFPTPRPMVANTTTRAFMPAPDYSKAAALYQEINDVTHRISLLESAVKAAGAYDNSMGSLQELLNPRIGNKMLPIMNWAAFAEKGGIRGHVDWFPVDAFTTAIRELANYRNGLVESLYQITGMSDILRGAASVGRVTAEEQRIKAAFGGARVQRIQEDFARYASELASQKAFLMAKFFDPERLLERSNAAMTYDAQRAMEAIAAFKAQVLNYRVKIMPEALAMADLASLQRERQNFIAAMAQFMSAAAPVAQMLPGSTPLFLEVLRWYLAAQKGTATLGGVLDAAIAQANQAAQQPGAGQPQQPPDPKILVRQMEGTQKMAELQAKHQSDMALQQAKAQADIQKEAAQAQYAIQEATAKEAIKQQGQRAGLPTAATQGGAA